MTLRAVAASAFLLSLSVASSGQRIHRLDGSTISAAEARERASRILTAEHVTGAELAVIEHGQNLWSAAFGLRQKDPDLPMATSTSIWAASLTKPVFAAYVLQLAESGRLNLDEPITKLLPLPLTSYPGYAETGVIIAHDARLQKVTPRMLLSHTAGFGNLVQFEPDHRIHFHSDPGAEFRYSGDGLNLLQVALEAKFGKPLEEQMEGAIFRPLRMSSTGMVHQQQWAQNIADRFDRDEHFRAKTRRFPARAAGSMTTNVEDMSRFLIALMDGKIIGRQWFKEMTSPAIAIRSVHQFPFPDDSGTSMEVQRVGLAYGLGVGLLTKTPYGPAFFKEGHGDGAQNYFVCFLKKKSCMVILTNSDNGELAFPKLLEQILGDNVTPLEWECYSSSCIAENRKHE